MITVTPPPPGALGDDGFVAVVCDLINRAYAVAEAGLWSEPVDRTSPLEVAERIRAGQLLVARRSDEIVGAVFTHLLDERTAWFGALAADPDAAGLGVGRALVAGSEQRALAAGASSVQIEVLAPTPARPHTSRLALWYGRLGYQETGRVTLARALPDLAGYLQSEACDLVTYRKALPV